MNAGTLLLAIIIKRQARVFVFFVLYMQHYDSMTRVFGVVTEAREELQELVTMGHLTLLYYSLQHAVLYIYKFVPAAILLHLYKTKTSHKKFACILKLLTETFLPRG